MNPSLASLICVCGIAGLFFLDRDNSLHTSKALWLPVAWLWIMGSRPVSFWLGVSPAAGTNVQLDGSPVDAAVLGVLLAAAIAVLIRRGTPARTFLTANGPILIYFVYCLISVLWSPYPDVAFKRWIKATGDLAMVLILVTEVNPAASLGRLFSRIGFVLFPTSVLFIKYYGYLGRGYGPGGELMNTGVTTNKNALGVILLVVSLGTVWRILTLVQDKTLPNRGRHLIAQLSLLGFEIALFLMADSATSLACFVLGTVLILATKLPTIKRRPSRVHALVAMMVLAGAAAMLLGGQEGMTHALGRQSNLSGRTDIWAAVIPALSKPIIGDGFESFWISPDVVKVWKSLSGWWDPKGLNEAHNGYIEVYLNLGWVGVGLISLILISGYRRATAAFQLNPSIGGLMLAYFIVAVVYNMTEAAFRMLDPIWIFLLLAIVSGSSIAAIGYIGLRPSPTLGAAIGSGSPSLLNTNSPPLRLP
jgi:exopolysaccharide production protein ExoQ